jgi:hypothetical protein
MRKLALDPSEAAAWLTDSAELMAKLMAEFEGKATTRGKGRPPAERISQVSPTFSTLKRAG